MTLTDSGLTSYTRMIEELHSRWKPHAGQIRVGLSYFRDQSHSIFVQNGRKWGKTELALYFLWRIAQSFPGSPCYYIAPLQNQAREIIWADPRLVNFGPREWLQTGSRGINHSEMRLNFNNGSFVKVDGSENYDKYRGPRYKLCIYEEYKDHKPEFRKAMHPNASVLQGVDLYVGTPPETEGEFTLLADEHKNTPGMAFHQGPTWENPHISRTWLLNEKKKLYLRGEGDDWEREYAARFIRGGRKTIFPMLSKAMITPHKDLIQKLHRDRKKLHWFAWCDPAGATCFAVLFVAINPYTKKVYVLDEIYEHEQSEMTTLRIGKRLIQKRDELHHRAQEWRLGYDEAATWFHNEWMDHFEDEEGLEPSHKHLNKKSVGLTLIKDIFLAGLLEISDRCEKFYWELDQYRKDDKGNIPKKDDHLIDCFRYILGAESYSLPEEKEIILEERPRRERKRLEDEFDELSQDGFNSDEWGEFNS